MEKTIRNMALLGLVGLGQTLMTNTPAWADATAANTAAIDALVEDITAHKALCGSVTAAQASLFKQCNNEQASLEARQKALGVSDDALNGNSKIKSRGWRWP